MVTYLAHKRIRGKVCYAQQPKLPLKEMLRNAIFSNSKTNLVGLDVIEFKISNSAYIQIRTLFALLDGQEEWISQHGITCPPMWCMLISCILLHGARNGPVYCERVLVYRNPGIHPGDIHIFRATWYPELQNILADGKYVILFPTKGPRSIVDEIAGGDLDGDLYWICMDQEVVKQFHSSAPWSHPPKPKEKSQKPSDMSYSQLEDELIKQVLDTMHHPSYAAGMSATNWLAHVDQYLMLGPEQHANRKVLEQILTQLMNINYAALISEKTGEKVTVPADLIAKKRPHFMKEGKEFYKSTSILGQIYDIVDNANQLDAEDSSPIYYPEFVYGGYKSHKSKWKGYFDEYRNEMSRACRLAQPFKSSRAEEIKQKYRSILYEAETLKLCPKPLAVIYEEAAAIYEVVCDHARENIANQRSSSCSFAWTVAGHALCRLYAEEQPGEPYVCAATVMTEVAGKLDLV